MSEKIKIEIGQVWDKCGHYYTIIELLPCDSLVHDDDCIHVRYIVQTTYGYSKTIRSTVSIVQHDLWRCGATLLRNWSRDISDGQVYRGNVHDYHLLNVYAGRVQYYAIDNRRTPLDCDCYLPSWADIDVMLTWLTEEGATLLP